MSRIEELIEDIVHVTDGVECETHRDRKVVGYLRADSSGHGVVADIDGKILTHGLAGPVSCGESGTLETCVRLVAHWNSIARVWIAPTGLAKDMEHVDVVISRDCEVSGDDSHDCWIQVTRACSDGKWWEDNAARWKHRNVRKDLEPQMPRVDQWSDRLRDSIQMKASDIQDRSRITLALNALDTPIASMDDVVKDFLDRHRAWAESLGFHSIWLVGPMSGAIHQLA